MEMKKKKKKKNSNKTEKKNNLCNFYLFNTFVACDR